MRLRGTYPIAPVILWGVSFAGATWTHLHTETAHGRAPGPHGTLGIRAAHGPVSLALVSAWWSSRALPSPAPTP